MKSYLVTGGTGFIGSAVIRAMLEEGYRVRCFDNLSRGSVGNLSGIVEQVELVTGDIRDPEAVNRAAKGMDGICHLAAINGTEYFYCIPEIVLEVATKGMLNVIDACIAHKIDDLVVMSSSEVYQTPPMIPTPENVPLSIPDPLNARYSYGGGKIISELLALNFGRRHIKKTRIVRPHNVYGPQMGWEHVVPQLICRIHELATSQPTGKLKVPIQGDGTETRSFIFIDDMARGFLKVLNTKTSNEIYHVGTSDEVAIKEVANEIARCMNREIEIVAGPLTAGSTKRRCPDTTKLSQLGFSPKTPLSQGITTTVNWYLDAIKTHQPSRKS